MIKNCKYLVCLEGYLFRNWFQEEPCEKQQDKNFMQKQSIFNSKKCHIMAIGNVKSTSKSLLHRGRFFDTVVWRDF